MEKRIKSFILEHNLIEDEVVICATSGGVDSVSLINILHNLGYKTVLAHVNHHKRIESEMEEKAMKELALKLNVPFEVLEYHYDGIDNFHNDSHNARYNFFKSLCIKYNTKTIASAHHLDDQIETILMKIMEGSNLYGYGGISISYNDGFYKVIRPLLCVTKDELYDYAKKNNLVYFEDSSNHEDDFLRNRLRHHVIPYLKKECSDLGKKTLEYNIQVKEAFDYIRKDSIKYLNDHDNKIEIESFNKLDIALKKDIISKVLENDNIRKNNNIVLSILKLLENDYGTKKIKLNDNFEFVRSYNYAYLKKNEDNLINSISVNIDDEVIYNNKYKFSFSKVKPNSNAKYIRLCYNKLNLPFIIRTKALGDTIELNIGNKKVSRILIDSKVRKDERDLVPIITDCNNEILWVYNYAKSKSVVDDKDDGDIYFVCEVL